MDETKKKKKRYKLRNLEIDRVDHVDRGANQHADIVFYKSQPDLNDVHEPTAPSKKKRKKTPTEELRAMRDLIEKARKKADEEKRKKRPFPPEQEMEEGEEQEGEKPQPPIARAAQQFGEKPNPKFPPGQNPESLPGGKQPPVKRPEGVTAPAPNPFARKEPAGGVPGQSLLPSSGSIPGRPAGLGAPPPGPGQTSQLQQMAEQKAKGGMGSMGMGMGKPPFGGQPKPPFGEEKPPFGGPKPPVSMDTGGGRVFNFYFSAEEVEERVDNVLESVTKGMIDSGVFVDTATGEDLRDMLPEETLRSLRKAVSAESADTTQQEDGMAQDTNLEDLPDTTVEYIKQLEGQVTELSKALEDFVYADEDPEMVEFEKALSELPEEVAAKVRSDQAKLIEIEKKNAQEAEERANAEFIAKARAFDGVVENPEEFGPQLRAVADMNPDLAESIEKVLSVASDRIMKGDLFSEVGHALPGDGSGAWEKATTIAKGMVEAGTASSIEVARAEVWEQNPGLFDEYQAERQGK